ncbi:uncharacterized protein METZ01_LOCUS312966, partial [marine metagenome]
MLLSSGDLIMDQLRPQPLMMVVSGPSGVGKDAVLVIEEGQPEFIE